MAQPGDISLKKIPACQAVRVEYPGYVEDMEAVIETLGGPEGLSRAAALGNSRLPLKFRPGDSLCRPIVGEKCAAKGLLVRVSKANLQEGPVSATVVARVPSSYRFMALSDFQFVADASLPAFLPKQGGPGTSLEEVTGTDPQPLLTVPPVFARTEDALNYQFRSFYGTDHPTLRAQGAGRAKNQLPPHVLKFASLRIVQPLKETDCGVTGWRGAALTELRKLFAERPVWSVLALQERMPNAKTANDSELLAKVAYVFRSGPFLSLWIRRGYDPRADRTSGKYQATVYTLPTDWAASLKQINKPRPDDLEASAENDLARAALPPVSQSYSELCRFAAVPRQSAILQLCDVQDLHVSGMASQTSQDLTTCDKHTGWYDAPVLEKMEKRIQGRFQALLMKYRPGGDSAPVEDTAGEGPSPMEVDAIKTPADRAADDNASVAEPEHGTRAEAEGGIFPEAMLEGLDTAWPNPSAPGGDADPTAPEDEEGAGGDVTMEGLELGDLGGPTGEDFLIFEASSSGSEAEDQGNAKEEDEDYDDDLDDSDDDEEEEEEAESSAEEQEDQY